MKISPLVSVVMAVYNGADTLPATLDSILTQEGVDLEFIVVNDGSTDDTGKILQEYAAQDPRLLVFEQENMGLTRSLIRGCAEARGEFIARQDCGDISLPGKLRIQLEKFQKTPGASMVSCGTRFVGPNNEILHEVMQDDDEATSRLLTLDIKNIRGPSHHGCVVFLKKLYNQVGGYRPDFYFAQDLDLWTRLVEQGKHVIVLEVLYQASYVPFSISGVNRKRQVEAAELILECTKFRRAGKKEDSVLLRAEKIRPNKKRGSTPLEQANSLYFIGMCLRKNGDSRSKDYFRQAVRVFPMHLKSMFRLLGR